MWEIPVGCYGKVLVRVPVLGCSSLGNGDGGWLRLASLYSGFGSLVGITIQVGEQELAEQQHGRDIAVRVEDAYGLV